MTKGPLAATVAMDAFGEPRTGRTCPNSQCAASRGNREGTSVSRLLSQFLLVRQNFNTRLGTRRLP